MGFKKGFLLHNFRSHNVKDEQFQKEKKLKHPMDFEVDQSFYRDLKNDVFHLMLELEDFENDYFDELDKISNAMDDTFNG